jgi:hypothetical protein
MTSRPRTPAVEVFHSLPRILYPSNWRREFAYRQRDASRSFAYRTCSTRCAVIVRGSSRHLRDREQERFLPARTCAIALAIQPLPTTVLPPLRAKRMPFPVVEGSREMLSPRGGGILRTFIANELVQEVAPPQARSPTLSSPHGSLLRGMRAWRSPMLATK